MGNNSVPKFTFRLSRFPVYSGSVLGRFYCIIYSEGVFVALGMQHAVRMSHIVICGLSGSTAIFNIIS